MKFARLQGPLPERFLSHRSFPPSQTHKIMGHTFVLDDVRYRSGASGPPQAAGYADRF